jgi:hypothetical protein
VRQGGGQLSSPGGVDISALRSLLDMLSSGHLSPLASFGAAPGGQAGGGGAGADLGPAQGGSSGGAAGSGSTPSGGTPPAMLGGGVFSPYSPPRSGGGGQ